jgi:hypothetical protein
MQISPTRMRVYRGRIIALLLNGCGVDPVQRACSSDGLSGASRASAAFIAAEVNFWGRTIAVVSVVPICSVMTPPSLSQSRADGVFRGRGSSSGAT